MQKLTVQEEAAAKVVGDAVARLSFELSSKSVVSLVVYKDSTHILHGPQKLA